MENLKDSSRPTSSSIHSKDTARMDEAAIQKSDVEAQSNSENVSGDEKEIKEPKEPKDPNLVDWDGPDDVSFTLLPALRTLCYRVQRAPGVGLYDKGTTSSCFIALKGSCILRLSATAIVLILTCVQPENPMNWTSAKKVTAIGIVSLITMLSPLASTMISPATASVLSEFNSTSSTLGAFITSVYLLGYSFGPLVIAPCSEQYGRVIVYNFCNFIFFIFNIACALAPNLSALIVFRMFAGIAASCPITLGAGTIADMVPIEKRGLAMASWILGPLVGPTFGPLGK